MPGQPGFGPTPGFGGPLGAAPPGGSRIGWIVSGAIAAAVVILVAVVSGVVLVLNDSSDDGRPSGQSRTLPTDVPTGPPQTSGSQPPPTGEVTGTYTYVDNLREAADFSPVFAVRIRAAGKRRHRRLSCPDPTGFVRSRCRTQS